MRDLRTSLKKQKRTRQRAALSLLVIAVSSSWLTPSTTLGAEPNALAPTATTFRIMPPLPLQPIQQIDYQTTGPGQTVRANPFCETEPVTKSVDPAIQLASGDAPAAIRLKPIGAAIGLHPIGSPRIVSSSGAALTIEELPAPSIQPNPLVGSAHHGNGDLVEAVVDLTSTGPAIPSTVNAQTSVNERTVESSPALDLPTSTDDQRDAVVDSPNLEPLPDSEPIYFSLSDDSTGLVVPADQASDESVEINSEEIDSETMAVDTTSRETDSSVLEKDSRGSENVVVEMATEPAWSNSNPNTGPQVQPQLRPLNETSESSAESMEHSPRGMSGHPHLTAQVAPTFERPKDATRQPAKRYRPPVAVQAPPLGYERSEGPTTAAAVQSVSPPMLSDEDHVEGIIGEGSGTQVTHLPQPTGAATPLYITRAQVRTLTIGGDLRRVSIEDQNICHAIAAGSNELKLIGAGHGTTRLVVWADGATDGRSMVRQFDVHVQDAVEATGNSVGDKAQLLTRTIKQSFPDSKVVVKTVGDQLVIHGTCSSEATASKILRMVRKTCLIPVRDELTIR
ncbi:hypothetical protein Pla52o_09150 [Novipirellula galeiformis]|uniref:Pilus formation protein N-terminal domain-containing protein n=1 Tax=Novipirellula galeiformis TaxID=2528004 RepID=A0A5C6CVR1_9BACT|nr:pilus assembly protein N-terminal domain-containing protein [Novipirellula galeiformis]TWU27056.1 hypothetical protein Pla52o_09150 [Novipirellula galeiformis]